MKKQTNFVKVLGWVITILTPIVILMLSIRLMIVPLFAKIEYRLPGFPDDDFGFSLSDRLRWSEPSIQYLVNKSDISYLEALKFDNGDQIYNQNELSHMEDVKHLVTGMRYALAGFLVVILGATIFLVAKGNKNITLKSYANGGWALFGLIGAIILFVLISFNQLFTWFHQLFFQSGNWMFYTSDTLIRLFPMRFWRDAFLFVGGLSILIAVLIILVVKKRGHD